MKTYIALLRGINVSGQKKIKMADLKLLFENLSFKNVRTYIQSGNVIFDSSKSNTSELASLIQSGIQKDYGFEVPILVVNSAYINDVVKNNPWNKDKNTDQMYFTFLHEVPSEENVEVIRKISFPAEEFVIDKDVIYFYSANGYGRAKMNNNYFENKLKVKATTRNWKTLNKIIAITNE